MSARDFAIEIMQVLQDHGHLAFMAGGCVRDELLGIQPSDYDVATDATPERIRAIFPRTDHVGAAFGVVLVKRGAHVIEVATFRADGTYTDARRPDSVTFSVPREDALRRDYTVNALFWSRSEPTTEAVGGAVVSTSHGGWLIDFVGGLADLKQRVIRAVGDADARLAEDHLRALRAVRLASKLGFEIDPGTQGAIRSHAAQLRGLSRERIGDEMRLMLEHPSRGRAAAWLGSLQLVSPILDEAVEDVREWPVTGALPGRQRFEVGLGAWLHDLGWFSDEWVNKVRAALMLSNEERDLLRSLVQFVPEGVAAWGGGGGSWPVARRKRFLSAPWYESLLPLMQGLHPEVARAMEADREHLAGTPSGLRPVPLVNGHMLLARGLRPGPAFRELLDAVYDAQLEERIAGQEEGLRLADELWTRGWGAEKNSRGSGNPGRKDGS